MKFGKKNFTETDSEYSDAKSLLGLIDFYSEISKKEVQGQEAKSYHKACEDAIAEKYEDALQEFLNLYVANPDCEIKWLISFNIEISKDKQ